MAPQDNEFVDAVVAGLVGGAIYQHSNVITADDLATFLRNKVHQTTPRSGSAGLESGGEFMFASQVNEQSTTASGGKSRPAKQVEPMVRYYKKSLDGLTVLRALDKCQIASKRDPLFASNNDPFGEPECRISVGFGALMRIALLERLERREGVARPEFQPLQKQILSPAYRRASCGF